MPTQVGLSKTLGSAVVPGGPIGEIKVPGKLSPGDTLLRVTQITEGAPPTAADLTAEFSITPGKGGTIQNTTTVTTGKFLAVLWARAD